MLNKHWTSAKYSQLSKTNEQQKAAPAGTPMKWYLDCIRYMHFILDINAQEKGICGEDPQTKFCTVLRGRQGQVLTNSLKGFAAPWVALEHT